MLYHQLRHADSGLPFSTFQVPSFMDLWSTILEAVTQEFDCHADHVDLIEADGQTFVTVRGEIAAQRVTVRRR